MATAIGRHPEVLENAVLPAKRKDPAHVMTVEGFHKVGCDTDRFLNASHAGWTHDHTPLSCPLPDILRLALELRQKSSDLLFVIVLVEADTILVGLLSVGFHSET